jgi:23S rRNA (uracil1939-C5)-methyltransferase
MTRPAPGRGGSRHARPAPTRALPPLDLTITAIGSAGDGIAPSEGNAPLHIARTLPGEWVRAQPEPGGKRAILLDLLQASPDRVAPPCPHFVQECGGCSLQHWDDAAYAAWKRGLVVAALERAGFAAPDVGALVRTAPASRRRMDFAVLRTQGGVELGLHQAHAKTIIDLRECTVLHPALFALVAPLRTTLRGLAALRLHGSVLANLLDDGPDLLIRTDGPLQPTDRAKLSAFAAAHGIHRVAWSLNDGPTETAAMLAAPHVTFGGVRVEPPPGAFLQASAEGEAAIVAAVLDAIPAKITGRSRAMELYAGCGTISFPLAAHLRVQAFEGDAASAACVRRAQSAARVEMTQRDLARQPLSAKELTGAAMIVLDPPYAGAAAQMAQIVASGVARVVYVSCNPGALSRDATVLAQAGYRLLRATPIDQFLWSAQVECVAVFEKGSPSF